ncbi:unnamed protein product [Gongylonema pulchrum]|uniref:Protein kinase domain-containing protein n=1 Tax=Gongylonema pulchrum TaxID=637853 RepID=A0A183DWM0_9BILA|nr:unnamed protein product [Gongylonema pulchrum]
MQIQWSIIWSVNLLCRLVTLTVFFVPLGMFLPVAYFWSTFREYWWRCAIWLVQRSGPTFIKLGQWASTRRDIFSKEFCDRMSILHTKTTFRQWNLSQFALDDLFGDRRWQKFIVSVQSDPVGSGCIAQVYKGVVDVHKFEEITGIDVPFAKSRYLTVAIKVAKEGVRERIAIDLSILRAAVRLVQIVLPGLMYVDPVSCLNQFEEVLKLQVDLRNEARALKRFSNNFDPVKTGVRFPQVLCYSRDVIIETHETGIYINRLVTDEHLMKEKSAVKKKVALIGARTLLKMIFVDNFVHGDLHPGNILVRFIVGHFLLRHF